MRFKLFYLKNIFGCRSAVHQSKITISYLPDFFHSNIEITIKNNPDFDNRLHRVTYAKCKLSAVHINLVPFVINIITLELK